MNLLGERPGPGSAIQREKEKGRRKELIKGGLRNMQALLCDVI